MEVRPIEIKRLQARGIQIHWSDGFRCEITSHTLRANCPCAGCREKRGDGTHARPLTGKKKPFAIVESSLEEETSLERVWAVGQYAIGFGWKDGHDTGIYTYDLLYRLGKESAGTTPSANAS